MRGYVYPILSAPAVGILPTGPHSYGTKTLQSFIMLPSGNLSCYPAVEKTGVYVINCELTHGT